MNARFTCEDVARAALGEPVKREGAELLYRCPLPEQHNNGDAHPSLKINTTKNVWSCFPCNAKGTAWALAARVSEASARLVARMNLEMDMIMLPVVRWCWC